jgi:tRNA modification GTPase
MNTTICALSTAPGMGAIALIRISGPKAFVIASDLGKKTFEDVSSHSAHFARIRNVNDTILDEVVITFFEENQSFTGEKTVEIACHGSIFIQQELLKLVLSKGAVLAEPGEFTMRSFLNGKMDLSQAEAVADLISSESSKAHEIAMNQMRGGFSNELKALREKLIHFASLVELELDFAEEDVEFADRKQLFALIQEVLAYIQRLIQSFELGNVLKHGVPVAIIGAPNTGKSTLLNQLLGEDRAIVSNIAGTTRDVIEETLNIEGVLYRLIDTAGIRDNAEEIEAKGIERTFEKMKQAKIVLLLAEYSETISNSSDSASTTWMDAARWGEERSVEFPNTRFLFVLNKVDLNQNKRFDPWPFSIPMIEISAKKGVGISELKHFLTQATLSDFQTGQETIVSNVRHLHALQRAQTSLEKASWSLDNSITGDFIAMDIRQAMYDLGTITSEISTDDLLGNIFSKFCIGK